jgi:hypothetical protein
MLRFTCPSCKTTLECTQSLAGVVIACGNCKAQMKVPEIPPCTSSLPTQSGSTTTPNAAQMPPASDSKPTIGLGKAVVAGGTAGLLAAGVLGVLAQRGQSANVVSRDLSDLLEKIQEYFRLGVFTRAEFTQMQSIILSKVISNNPGETRAFGAQSTGDNRGAKQIMDAKEIDAADTDDDEIMDADDVNDELDHCEIMDADNVEDELDDDENMDADDVDDSECGEVDGSDVDDFDGDDDDSGDDDYDDDD